MSQYWIANNPGSTLTSSEAERVAVVGRGLESNGKISVAGVIISSAIADPTNVIMVNISPSTGATKVVGTTDGSTAIAGAALTDSGLISIQALTSTGGTVRRYIKIFST